MTQHFYIEKIFDDFDELSANAELWNVSMNQLHRGKTINVLKQLSTGRISMNYLLFNGHKTTKGDPPLGKTFAFYEGLNSELRWRNKRVVDNQMMIYPNGAEHEVMTKGDATHVYTITIPEIVWSSYLTSKELNIDHEILNSQDIVTIPAHLIIGLKQRFLSYFKTLKMLPSAINQAQFRKRIEEDMTVALIHALSFVEDKACLSAPREKTLKIWERIDLILRKTDGYLLPINELCRAVGVSERTLRRIFHERYLVSPKSFMIKARLNGVRSDLKKRPFNEVNIADIANNWGFWHIGQFAKDYRFLFGELPSDTQRRYAQCE